MIEVKKSSGSVRRMIFVEEHLDVAAIAARIGVSERTIWAAHAAWRKTGRGLGPARKLGARTIFSASTVNGWLKSNEVRA